MPEQSNVASPVTPQYAVYIKLGMLLASILVLLVPLVLMLELVRERANRRDQVVREIGAIWGPSQSLTGPVLIIPYVYEYTEKETVETADGKTIQRDVKRRATAHIYVLPDTVKVAGTVAPSERYRGIYKSTVYQTALAISGAFARPDLDKLGIEPGAVKWSEAVVALGLTDPRSTNSGLTLTWGGRKIPFEPETTIAALLGAGIHAAAPLDPPNATATGRLAFALDLAFAGHKRLAIAPVGKVSEVDIASTWQHPSFDGAYLPAQREIGPDGFKARWKVSYLGRGYPQVWTDQPGKKSSLDPPTLSRKMARTRIGLSLVTPVDFYLKSERAVKYGILFVVLVFAAIFVFELVSGAYFHPVQYFLVGIALSLFYLLLLSLSEVVGFTPAYGIAALMATALISLYVARAIGGWRRSLFLCGLLTFVYGYLYVILQLEDLALVFGAVGLFAALASVMYFTRNIDWNVLVDPGRRKNGATPAAPVP